MLNRERIFERIASVIAAARASGDHVAVMLVRLHGLREICLRSGYAAGDAAVAVAGERLRESLRARDEVHQAGEDLFVAILGGLRNGTHAQLAAVRAVAAFDMAQRPSSTPWQGRVAIGVAMFPEHAPDPERLCRLAERAHDEALRSGQAFVLHGPLPSVAEIRYEDLRDAIQGGRLEVFFQPIWRVHDGTMLGVESLARWFPQDRSPVSPVDFIAFAEHHDLIEPLSQWSLQASLRHLSTLPPGHGLELSLNLSPQMFSTAGLVERVLGALEIWSLQPSALCVEVTETTAIQDMESSVNVLRRLHNHGVRVAIDDFGTGYASFAYLRRLPATELKIDMSLIRGMRDDARTARLVQAMIDTARHMQMRSVAEGVEDEATLSMLREMGCDAAQGFLLGRPEPASRFVERQVPTSPSGGAASI